MFEKNKKIAKIISTYLQKTSFPGVCGFWIDEESITEDEKIFIYLILDETFIKNSNVRPDHLAIGMRNRVKRKIDEFLGEELVNVGSIVRNCEII